ncbi:histidine kinase [Paramesorhizobium deserti]|uniref:Blue-light-activated histidine kinase n=2 Tax=Paramesorhizobium deserti TaxID=1494590 RepID=A0A135HQV5_9HYPH|nr:histidine kinase [Paramesorhizobium deserti]
MRRKKEFETILQTLQAALYTTDAEGRISFYNEAAAELWGVRPELGKDRFCGSWKLYWPDGTSPPHDECPMAISLKEKRAIAGMEAAAERPDGHRVPFLAFPTPLFDEAGELTGAVNLLVDITGRKIADETAQRLAAIVESSDDAILSKDLNGIITSWNNGAERLYGYKAHEVIGQPVTVLMPSDRQDEEPRILARIRRGERIDHYETVRQHKDGTLIDISLTVSPIRNAQGRIVGASKIARNITERKQAQEQQRLLLREMNHRVKNLFTLSSSLVTLSARSAGSTEELISGVRERFAALAQAHSLTLPQMWDATAGGEGQTTLHALIRSILLPFEEDRDNGEPRAVITGPDLPLSGTAVTNFALLLHEFATNAAKYGALSAARGCVDITCREDGGQFVLTWRERGGPPVESEPADEGFGTLLMRATLGPLGGRITRDWSPEGLMIMLSVARDQAIAR